MESWYKKFKYTIALLLLFLLEFLLFKSYVERVILTGYPIGFDQAVFMEESYKMYESIIERNWKVVFHLVSITGQGVLPIVGCVFLFLFGNSRFSLLLINFLGFILVQLVGFWAVKKMSGSNKVGGIYIGLLLMIQSPFRDGGGLFDYRMDFLGFCLYTCWMVTIMTAYFCKDKKIYYGSAFFAGMALMFRSNIIAYLGIAFLIFEIIYIFILKERKLLDEIISLLKYGGVVLLSGGWYMMAQLKTLIGYYSNHVIGDEPLVRLRAAGITNKVSYILYYPRSLIKGHLGNALSWVLLVIALASIAWYFIHRKKQNLKIGRNETVAFIVCIAGFIAPFIVLTIDMSKSPTVICTVAGITVILFLFFFILDYNRKLWANLMVWVLCLGFLGIGIIHYVDNTTKILGRYKKSFQKEVRDIHQCMEEYIEESKLEDVKLLIDRMGDAINPYVLACLYYEDKEEWINVEYAWKEILVQKEYNDDEVAEALLRADLMTLSRNPYSIKSAYPVDASMEQYREYMLSYANEYLEELGRFSLDNDTISVYGRIRGEAEVYPKWEDGWLGEENNFIVFDKKSEKQNEICMEGFIGGGIDEETEVELFAKWNGGEIPCEMSMENSRYYITMDISHLETGPYTLELKFKDYFIPSGLGTSNDTRRLVVRVPDFSIVQ